MKKVFFTVALCLSSAAAFAQILDVASVNKVAIAENPAVAVAGISPQGDYILVTDAQNKGLSKYDLATGKTTVLTTAPGAGYAAQISADGQNVVYRETSYTKDDLRMNTLKKQNLATGEIATLVNATRDLQGVAIENGAAVAVNKGKVAVKSLGAAKAKVNAPVLSIKNRQLMMTVNGKTKVFSPNGTDVSYIWPSLSPDGTKVLYYVCGNGAYICNIDGSGVKYLGHFTSPKWYNDEVVVAMNDKDNGDFVTSSEIVAIDLDGNTQTLTDSSVIAMYPYASAQGNKIAFSTPAGEAYIININVKK